MQTVELSEPSNEPYSYVDNINRAIKIIKQANKQQIKEILKILDM